MRDSPRTFGTKSATYLPCRGRGAVLCFRYGVRSPVGRGFGCLPPREGSVRVVVDVLEPLVVRLLVHKRPLDAIVERSRYLQPAGQHKRDNIFEKKKTKNGTNAKQLVVATATCNGTTRGEGGGWGVFSWPTTLYPRHTGGIHGSSSGFNRAGEGARCVRLRRRDSLNGRRRCLATIIFHFAIFQTLILSHKSKHTR